MRAVAATVLVVGAVVSSLGLALAADVAVEKELKRLEGTWQLISAEADGKKVPQEQVRQIKVVIQGNTHSVYFGEKVITEKVAFTIDPNRKPKWTEDTLKDGRKIRGIYELSGDTLRSCVAPVDKDRPAEFTGRAGTGYTLRVFQRVKAPTGADGNR